MALVCLGSITHCLLIVTITSDQDYLGSEPNRSSRVEHKAWSLRGSGFVKASQLKPLLDNEKDLFVWQEGVIPLPATSLRCPIRLYGELREAIKDKSRAIQSFCVRVAFCARTNTECPRLATSDDYQLTRYFAK